MENYGGTAAPPGHLSSYDTSVTTRGNLTGVTSYTDVVAGTSVHKIASVTSERVNDLRHKPELKKVYGRG
jgi:hypothetical protein